MNSNKVTLVVAFLLIIAAAVTGFYVGHRRSGQTRPAQSEMDSIRFDGRPVKELLEQAGQYRTLKALFEAVGEERYEWKALEEEIKKHPDPTFRKMARQMTNYDSTGSSPLAAPLEKESHQVNALPAAPDLSEGLMDTHVDQSLADALAEKPDSLPQANLKNKPSIQNSSFEFESIHGAHILYIGNTVNGKATGQGKGIFDSGSIYEGEWRDNMRHGDGRFQWKDGDVYEGKYKFGRRDGYGVYTFSNGERYEGEWKDDKRHGSGIYYGKNGKILAEGDWQEDRLQ